MRISKFFQNNIIVICSSVFPIAYLFFSNKSMIFAPDSYNYINENNIAPLFFRVFLTELLYFENFFHNNKIIFLEYICLSLYSLSTYLISRYFYLSKKKLYSIIIIPFLWSSFYLTPWFKYILTDGISICLIFLSFAAFLNFDFKKRQAKNSVFFLLLFFTSSYIVCFIRPALLIFFIVPIIMMMKKSVRSKKIILITIISSIFSISLYISTMLLINKEMPRQLGGVLTALTFNYSIDLDRVNNHKEKIVILSDSLEKYINEYNNFVAWEKCNESNKLVWSHRDDTGHCFNKIYSGYIYKILNNTRVTNTAYRSLVGKSESQEITVDDVYYSEPILRQYAINKIYFNLKQFISEVFTNAYYSVQKYGDRFKLRVSNTVELEQIYQSSLSNSERALKNYQFKINKLEIEDLEINKFEKFIFTFNYYLPEFYGKYMPLIISVLLFSLCFSIFMKGGFYASLFYSLSVYIFSIILFQNLVFPTIPRLIDVINPISTLMILSIIFYIFEIFLKVFSIIKKKYEL